MQTETPEPEREPSKADAFLAWLEAFRAEMDAAGFPKIRSVAALGQMSGPVMEATAPPRVYRRPWWKRIAIAAQGALRRLRERRQGTSGAQG